MWPLDEASAAAAKWITGVLGGLAIAWKIFLRVRRDAREDGAGGASADGYALIITGLREEMTRLHASLTELAGRCDTETAARYQAESELAACRRRTELAEATAEQAFRRAAAAQEVVDLYRTQISALEDEVARLTQASGGAADVM